MSLATSLSSSLLPVLSGVASRVVALGPITVAVITILSLLVLLIFYAFGGFLLIYRLIFGLPTKEDVGCGVVGSESILLGWLHTWRSEGKNGHGLR